MPRSDSPPALREVVTRWLGVRSQRLLRERRGKAYTFDEALAMADDVARRVATLSRQELLDLASRARRDPSVRLDKFRVPNINFELLRNVRDLMKEKNLSENQACLELDKGTADEL